MRQYTTACPGSVILEAVQERVHTRSREADVACSDISGDVSVHIMPQYLTSIITEIVDNACAFSDPGSPISVTVSYNDTILSVHVTDRGVGMSAEECASIGPYRQFRRSIQEQQGVGLGLTIAQRLVELHDGSLAISSNVNEGTTVSVSLPRADVGVVQLNSERVSAPPKA